MTRRLTQADNPSRKVKPGRREGLTIGVHYLLWLSGQQFGQGSSSPVTGQV